MNQLSTTKQTWLDVFQAENRAKLVRAVAVIVLAALAWRLIGQITQHKTIVSGPAAPWNEQLALAQGAADKIEAGSVLTSTEAQPDSDLLPYTMSSTLDVYFVFIAPSGHMTGVKVEDSSPPYIKYTADAGPAKSKPDRAQLDKLRAAVAEIKLSPRGALNIIANDLHSKYKSLNIPPPGMQLFFKENAKDSAQNASKTDVEYSGMYGEIGFTVDATNGNILEERDLLAEPTPTPSP